MRHIASLAVTSQGRSPPMGFQLETAIMPSRGNKRKRPCAPGEGSRASRRLPPLVPELSAPNAAIDQDEWPASPNMATLTRGRQPYFPAQPNVLRTPAFSAWGDGRTAPARAAWTDFRPPPKRREGARAGKTVDLDKHRRMTAHNETRLRRLACRGCVSGGTRCAPDRMHLAAVLDHLDRLSGEPPDTPTTEP